MFDYINPPTQMEFKFHLEFEKEGEERYVLADEAGNILEFFNEKGNIVTPTEQEISYVKYAVWGEKTGEENDFLTVKVGELFVTFISRLKEGSLYWDLCGFSRMDPSRAEAHDISPRNAYTLTVKDKEMISAEVSKRATMVIAEYPDYQTFFETYQLKDLSSR